MAEPERARHLLERAEQAAMSGDFASADELLKAAASIQEKELGPDHPDLANTLTNRAIVAEKTGRAVEAETLYRRAATIAAAALPLNDPMVVESRQNLEDFCRAHGLPIVVPKAVTPTEDSDREVAAVAPEVPPKPPTPMPLTAKQASYPLAWLAAAVVLLAVVLLLWRPWSSRETSTQANTSEPKTEQPAQSAPRTTTAPPESSATVRKESPKPAVRDRERPITTSKPPAASGVTLAIAEVCRDFSTSGSKWRCEPVGSSVRPGPMVLYTRVKSPRDTAVVHRWYHGTTLRQSVKLGIRGNATEGYRTYSRQTVDDGDWRVEVRSVDGALLHEQRFAVK
jgi:DUF2914 family protein/tetratricopeptide repeat protein